MPLYTDSKMHLKVLRLVDQRIVDTGLPPTYQEIAVFRIGRTSVYRLIEAMERRDLLQRSERLVKRSLRVTVKGRELLDHNRKVR